MIRISNLKISIILALITLTASLSAQDDDSGKLPVRSPWETGILIDNPTVVSPYKGALELNIQHRFGTIKNGITDIYGIYAPSNIRMALNYGVTDRIMVGFGTTKDSKLQDFDLKVALIQQNRSGSVPVSLSFFGNFVVNASSKDNFGPEERYKAIHRFSYFSELILSRKFSDMLSLQLAPSFSYFNAIAAGSKNNYIGISGGGRVKILSSSSIIFEYDQAVTESDSKSNLGIGYEIGTATHCFQIVMSNNRLLIPQHSYAINTNDFSKGEFSLGFNITVRF